MPSHETQNSASARYALKAGILIVGLMSTLYLPYLLLGLWNRIFGGWNSVFYCYAGSTQFIDTYAPRFLIRTFRWLPVPIGILKQGATRGVVIASPVSEQQFLDPENEMSFRKLQNRIKLISRLLGVPRVSLSGILPSVVGQHGILTVPDSRPVVKHAVCAAVKRLVTDRFAGGSTSVIVIGGAGYIGQPISNTLRAQGMDVFVLDPKSGEAAFPEALEGKPCIVLDCSRKGVIDGYVNQMWPGMVLLNEVFPRTSRAVVEALSTRGVECWHLSGLAGSIFPALPHGYGGAVPCCAAHENSVELDLDVVLVSLTLPTVSPQCSTTPINPLCEVA